MTASLIVTGSRTSDLGCAIRSGSGDNRATGKSISWFARYDGVIKPGQARRGVQIENNFRKVSKIGFGPRFPMFLLKINRKMVKQLIKNG